MGEIVGVGGQYAPRPEIPGLHLPRGRDCLRLVASPRDGLSAGRPGDRSLDVSAGGGLGGRDGVRVDEEEAVKLSAESLATLAELRELQLLRLPASSLEDLVAQLELVRSRLVWLQIERRTFEWLRRKP